MNSVRSSEKRVFRDFEAKSAEKFVKIKNYYHTRTF